MDPTTHLSQHEREVVNLLAEAFNTYQKLPVLHSDASEEFRHTIHRAQHLVMARPVQEQFNNEPPPHDGPA
jgi:hypothetical protein